MNKQEAIEKIESNSLNIGNNDLVVGLDVARHIINQIDEQQKVVVPQFVADWYKDNQDDLEVGVYDLCVNLYNCDLEGKIKYWFDCDSKKPIETLVKMKLFGYEVEKEKLYTVGLPNNLTLTHIILTRNIGGEINLIETQNNDWEELEYAQLTESEIKEDFEWAWPFAEEVK